MDVWVFKARSLHPLPASGRSTWCKLISVSFDREIRGPSSSSSTSILTSFRCGESTLGLSCGRRPLLVSKQCRLFVKIPVATMVFFCTGTFPRLFLPPLSWTPTPSSCRQSDTVTPKNPIRISPPSSSPSTRHIHLSFHWHPVIISEHRIILA